MTALSTEARFLDPHRPEPRLPRSGRRRSFHRRLAAYIATRSARRWAYAGPWPYPTFTGALAVFAVGCMWGSIIGFALGGSVGALYFLIGALYGAPVGAIVGLLVAGPASIALAALLVTRDRPATDTERLARHVAGQLAALIELLTTAGLAALAIVAAHSGGWSVSNAVLTTGSTLLLSAAAVWLLRFAARDLIRTWARAWGWRVVR